MKKQIIYSIKFVSFFIIILCIIDTVLSFGIKHNTTSIFAKPIKICSHTSFPSIAIFSSSVGEMGYNPNIIENITHQSAYNFSLNGNRFMHYKGLIDELSSSSNNTKVVVLSEMIFSFEKLEALNNIERFLPCITNNNLYNSLHDIQPDLTFKCRYIPFYKYIATSNNYYLQSFIGLKNFITHKKDIDSLKGQTRVYRNWEADQDSIWKYAKPIPIKIDDDIVNTYKKTIANIVAQHRKVVIAISPIYMPQGQKIIDIRAFRAVVQSMADNKNIFFFDFSEAMVDKKYFYNVLHMNAIGADVYSKMFAEKLSQAGVMR